MKKVLITGATGSLGEAMVRYFANEGYFVYIHYNTQKEKAQSLLESIEQGEIIQCGLTNKKAGKKGFVIL